MENTTYTTGQQVKFSQPESTEEAALRMTIIEDNGNRVIVSDNLGWEINPTHVYSKTDIISA